MKSIELIIGPDGQFRIETLGFSGPHCLPATEFLRKSLGQVVQETRTAAFYAANADASSALTITPPQS